jgi:hypothetical protein
MLCVFVYAVSLLWVVLLVFSMLISTPGMVLHWLIYWITKQLVQRTRLLSHILTPRVLWIHESDGDAHRMALYDTYRFLLGDAVDLQRLVVHCLAFRLYLP